MRKILVVIVVCLCSFSSWAQDSTKNKQSLSEAQIQIQKLELRNKQLENEQALYLIAKQERETLISTFTKLCYGVGAVFLLFGFTGLYSLISGYKKLRKELLEKIEKHHLEKFQEEVEKLRGNIIEKFADSLKVDPKSLEKVLREEIKNTELKAKTKINLVGDTRNKMQQVQLQLEQWGIDPKNITVAEITPDQLNTYNCNNDSITLIVDNGANVFATKSTERQVDFPVFYLGGGFFNVKFSKKQNFAKTEVTIYQNLMDLIRYLD